LNAIRLPRDVDACQPCHYLPFLKGCPGLSTFLPSGENSGFVGDQPFPERAALKWASAVIQNGRLRLLCCGLVWQQLSSEEDRYDEAKEQQQLSIDHGIIVPVVSKMLVHVCL
jgi:hypothetical protein